MATEHCAKKQCHSLAEVTDLDKRSCKDDPECAGGVGKIVYFSKKEVLNA